MLATMSNRARDRRVKEGVRALRNKPGWDPKAIQRKSPAEQLRDLEQSERTEESYREAAGCEACQAEQRATGDATALCPHHLSEAMGL